MNEQTYYCPYCTEDYAYEETRYGLHYIRCDNCGAQGAKHGSLDDAIEKWLRIAATPELLEACEAFVEAWEKSLQLEKTDVALRMAKAAIRKAKGHDK